MPQPIDPFQEPVFQDGFAALGASTRAGWQRWAEEAVLLSDLAAQVPRESASTARKAGAAGDLAWKSFLREIAVVRRCSDQAAGKEVFLAVALTRSYPCTLALLQEGLLPRYQAQVLIEESAGCSPEVIALVDSTLADRAMRMTPSRIRATVAQLELRHDADAAAARAATATAARGTQLLPQSDGQAQLVLTGPALPVVEFYEALTAAARQARAAGDPRGLDALRFDLAVGAPPPDGTDLLPPLDTTDSDVEAAQAETETGQDASLPPLHAADSGVAAADLDSAAGAPAATSGANLGLTVPAWAQDRRRLRPIQVLIHLPVTTALGLDNEPGWLAGYGWISAPQCRQWLTNAELRQVCVSSTGQVVDLTDRTIRPQPTPAGVRDALLDMVADPGPITDKTWRTQPQHDPNPALRAFIDVRDLACDGPTGTRITANRCDLDHDTRYPDGPTAAWNLVPRSRRTHTLKHHGWTPVRTATSTLWFSPAGQLVETERWQQPPPDLDPHALLPDPHQLHAVESRLVHIPEDEPPFDEPPF